MELCAIVNRMEVTPMPTRTVLDVVMVDTVVPRHTARALGRQAAAAGATLVATRGTLEALARASSDHGPMTLSLDAMARAIGCPVDADPGYLDGLVAVVTD